VLDAMEEGPAAASPLHGKRRVVSVKSPTTSTTPGSAESDRTQSGDAGKSQWQQKGDLAPPAGLADCADDDCGEKEGPGLPRTLSRSSSNGLSRPSLKWSVVMGLHRQSSNQSMPEWDMLGGADGDLEVPSMPTSRAPPARTPSWMSNASSDYVPRVGGRRGLGRNPSFMEGDQACQHLIPTELFCDTSGATDALGFDCASPQTPDDCTPGVHTPRAAGTPRRRWRMHSPVAPARGVLERTLSSLARDQDSNDGRFARDFTEVQQIGEGSFSMVFKARNKVDNYLYAIKRTNKINQGGREKIQEAVVHAAMTLESQGSSYVVRYFSSWFESGQLFIQMELCQGTLRDAMQQMCEEREDDPRYREAELVEVIADVTHGLQAMHTSGFVHLDIKPDNIMRGRAAGARWKIGDLGLAVAAIDSQCDDVCEGDCRYLDREVLQGRLSNLAAADIFSLGAMVCELATNPEPLPCGGEKWQELRDGDIDFSDMPPYSEPLRDLMERLVDAEPDCRPSCAEILSDPSIHSAATAPAYMKDEEVRKLQQELERQRRRAQEYKEDLDNMRKKCQEGFNNNRPRLSGPMLLNGAFEPVPQRTLQRHKTR